MSPAEDQTRFPGRCLRRKIRRLRRSLRARLARRTTPGEQLRALRALLLRLDLPSSQHRPWHHVSRDEDDAAAAWPQPLAALELIPVIELQNDWTATILAWRTELQTRAVFGVPPAHKQKRKWGFLWRPRRAVSSRGPWTPSAAAIQADHTWMQNTEPHPAPIRGVHEISRLMFSTVVSRDHNNRSHRLPPPVRATTIRTHVFAASSASAAKARQEAALFAEWLTAHAAHPDTFTARGTPAVAVVHGRPLSHVSRTSPPTSVLGATRALWEIQLRVIRDLLQLLPRHDVLFPVPPTAAAGGDGLRSAETRARNMLSRRAFACFLGYSPRRRDRCGGHAGVRAGSVRWRLRGTQADAVPLRRRVLIGAGIVEALAELPWQGMTTADDSDSDDSDNDNDNDVRPTKKAGRAGGQAGRHNRREEQQHHHHRQNTARPYHPPPQPLLAILLDLTSTASTSASHAGIVSRLVWALQTLATRNGAMLTVIWHNGDVHVLVGDAQR